MLAIRRSSFAPSLVTAAAPTEYARAVAPIPIAAITAMGIVGQLIQNEPGIVANGCN
jgi:hypothetical protein